MQKKTFSFIQILVLLFITYSGLSQNIQWQKALGGSDHDFVYDVENTNDGGYIVAGDSRSFDGDATYCRGYYDIWIVKFNAGGAIQWQKSLGGDGFDNTASIKSTADGGYIILGSSSSRDGDVTGIHHAAGSPYYSDIWVVKIDSIGTIEWQKTLGGTLDEYGYGIDMTSDGGYIVVGETASSDGDISNAYGNYDVWVVKLSAIGDLQWEKTFGGQDTEHAYSIATTPDGGYIFTGENSLNNVWVVKLYNNGLMEWQKTFGGSNWDLGSCIKPTPDGGYILTAYTQSNNNDVTGNHLDSLNNPSMDIWVLKLNSVGEVEWKKTFGGTSFDVPSEIQVISSNSYLLVGSTLSADGDITNNIYDGQDDIWVIKLDGAGNIIGQKVLGGTNIDHGIAIKATPDGGCIVVGSTISNDGDINGYHVAFTSDGYPTFDGWVVKLDNSWVGVEEQSFITDFRIFPNPTSNGKCVLKYYLSKVSEIEINIIDVLGNTVFQQKEITQSEGIHSKELNLNELPNGMFFLQLRTKYGTHTQMIIKN